MQTAIDHSYMTQRMDDFAADCAAAIAQTERSAIQILERIQYALAMYGMVLDYGHVVPEFIPFGSPEHLAAAEHMEAMFNTWLVASRDIEQMISRAEAEEQTVSGRVRFREAVLDVMSITSIPARRTFDRQVRLAREGPTPGKTTQEIRVELQRRLGA